MNTKYLKEGLAKLSSGSGVFYNKEMEMCRSISSLWVGTLPKLKLGVDGFCASGVRGIRYLKENKTIGKIEFVDWSKKAILQVKKNLKLNKIGGRKGKTVCGNVNKYFMENFEFDFAEIDPFGTPVPYLDSLFQAEGRGKERYVSITATDVAVLCGAHYKACIKNYGANPLDNEFCHENALRILIGKIARVGAQYEWELIPEFCFSHKHYVKVLAKVRKGAEGAVESVKKSMKYVEYCPTCLYHKLVEKGFPKEKCPVCGKKLIWAGPMWGGKIFNKKIIEKMQKL
ncbi:MAG: hypothetical protein ABIH83_04460, partial [Candidatus Micrarchaeota archaeon]